MLELYRSNNERWVWSADYKTKECFGPSIFMVVGKWRNTFWVAHFA
jgi:hypothetical protein